LNRDQLSSGLFFLFGLLVCFFSIPYKLGALSAPGSGLMPFLSGAAMCCLAAIGFSHATLRRLRGEGWGPLMKGRVWQRGLLTLGGQLAFLFLLQPLGFFLTTVLFMGFLLRVVVPQSWPRVITVAVLTATIAYLVFEVWLKVQLPAGPLGI
jgi:putative tricarboxylic transport membrane protein